MYVCNTIAFESRHLESSFSHIQYIFMQAVWVKFIHEGHQVKVKVTVAKMSHFTLQEAAFVHTVFSECSFL